MPVANLSENLMSPFVGSLGLEVESKFPSRTVAEFFAGIGLMRLGLERAGWRIIWANDIDPKKQEMYEGHFSSHASHFILEDIHRLEASEIPPVALATASFPCTDLSLAGARQGLNGAQSSAFWGFIDILTDWGAAKPPLVLIENVLPFVTSNAGSDFEEAMLALNNLGYTLDALTIDARSFVPQSRLRLFVVGTLGISDNQRHIEHDDVFRPTELRNFIETHPNIDWYVRPLPPLPFCTTGLTDVLEDLPDSSSAWWSTERAAYLLSQMSERHRAQADRMIAAQSWTYGTVFRRVRNKRSMAELRTDGIAGCLRTPKGGSARQILFKAGFGKYKARFLTAQECANLMGAEGFTMNVSLNQALFGFGDAVCVPAVEWLTHNYLNPVAAEIELAPK